MSFSFHLSNDSAQEEVLRPAVTTLAFVFPGTVHLNHRGSTKARNLGSCTPAHLDWPEMEYEDPLVPSPSSASFLPGWYFLGRELIILELDPLP